MSNRRDNMDGGLDGGAANHDERPRRDIDAAFDGGRNAGGRDASIDSPVAADGAVARSDASIDAPNVLRPARRIVNARWLATQARCGDEVELRAVVTGYPDDTSATLEIYVVGAAGVVATKTVVVTAGVIQTRFRVFAVSANWRAERLKFRVIVPDLALSGESENELAFRDRPTAGWETIRQELPGTIGSVHRIYDQALERSRVHISVKVALTGLRLTADQQLAEKRNIEAVWNNGFNPRYRFRRVNCRRGASCPGDACNLGFRLEFNFVTADPHITVELRNENVYDGASQMNRGRRENTSRTTSDHPLDGWRRRIETQRICLRSYVLNLGEVGDECSRTVWYYPAPSPSIFPHEVGHILGCFDEYHAGVNDRQGYQPYPSSAGQTIPAADQTLMSTFGVTTMPPRFYRYFLWFLNRHADGDPYVIYDTATDAVYRFP